MIALNCGTERSASEARLLTTPVSSYKALQCLVSNNIKFSVDFDTGSSDLFLPGPNCGSTCSGHTKYDPSKSSASKSVGQSFSLQYGDGSTVSGEQYTDTVSIAGLTVSSHLISPSFIISTDENL